MQSTPPVVDADPIGATRVVMPCSPVEGPVTASLQFRVGIGDETLPQRGITHLVEHLALSVERPRELEWNAFVDLTRTVFHARGDGPAVARWLGRVAERLHDLPLGRLEHERRVLEAESLQRGGHIHDSALGLRYGVRGPGVAEFRELGLRRIAADELGSWAERFFTAPNAVIWTSADLPALRLDLPDGDHHLPTLPDTIVSYLPAALQTGPAVLLAAPVKRSTAMSALFRHLQRRCEDALRHERGIAYHVAPIYMPYTHDVAFAAVSTDVVQEHAEEAQAVMLDAIRGVSVDGVNDEELAADFRDATRQLDEPTAVYGRLEQRTHHLLHGGDLDIDGWIEELRVLTPGDVAEAAREFLSQALLLGPATSPPDGFHSYVPRPVEVSGGHRVRPRHAPRQSAESLYLADEGVRYVSSSLESVSVRFARCAGVLAWNDGSRTLYDEHGTVVSVDVREWRHPERITAHIDVHTRQPHVPMGEAPTRDEAWEQERNRAVRQYRLRYWGTYAAIFTAFIVLAIGLATAGLWHAVPILAAFAWYYGRDSQK